MTNVRSNPDFVPGSLITPDLSLAAEVADLYEMVCEEMVAAVEAILMTEPDARERGYLQGTKDMARRVMTHFSGGANWADLRPRINPEVLAHADVNTHNYEEDV